VCARRAALLLLLLLAACGRSGPPIPTSFAPLTYEYLTRLPLNVAAIDIDDSWSPPPVAGQVGPLSPVPPQMALRQMAQDRLFAAGGSGRGVFQILDASIVQVGGNLQASFAVRLTVTSGDGLGHGFAEARVLRTAPFNDARGLSALRAALYDLTRATMENMNVEFEYQIRRALRDYLQAPGAAPASGPVQSETLGPPGTTSPAGAPMPLAPPPFAQPASPAPPPSAPTSTAPVPDMRPVPNGPLQLAPPTLQPQVPPVPQ
jgi:hypothetical protein